MGVLMERAGFYRGHKVQNQKVMGVDNLRGLTETNIFSPNHIL